MQIWNSSQIPQSEREDILSKHREIYNGYQTMQPEVKNTQPLYVQDFAKDKQGVTMTTKGEVKPYTNYRINESHVMDTCNECGGVMTEGECSECGYKMEEMGEGKSMCSECGGMMREGECSECGYKMEEMGEKYETGHLDDIYDEEDLNPEGEFDYVGGAKNKNNTFEKMHHMKSIKNEVATSNAPLSYGKHYNEVEPPYEFKSNGPVGDGGTLRQKNIHEGGYTGGGNAPDFDIDFENPAYDFESEGPDEDTFTIPAGDMDLDSKDVKKPYDFVSGGPDNGGEAYPMFEDECEECWDKMESAFADEELDEIDVSGVQGIYGAAKKPYAFVSSGPGKAGPYQTHSWGGEDLGEEYEGEDEDVYWEKDLEPGELELDLTKFNPEDKSWSEITAYTGEDEFSHLDENLKESFIKQKNKIVEMFERFKRYN